MKYVEKINQQTVALKKNWNSTRLGASVIGSLVGIECDRYLWYSYRWYPQKKDTAEVIRAKEKGKRAETSLLMWLNRSGADVTDLQYKAMKGNLVAKLDGIINDHTVLSFKTMKQTSFNAVKKHGIKKAFLPYYIQSQVEMCLTGLKETYYLIWCKNSEELYEETIQYDPSVKRHIARAKSVTEQNRTIPARLSENADFYLCKSLCPYTEVCHFGKPVQQNCRNCAYCDGSTWNCEKRMTGVDTNAGCSLHKFATDESETFFEFP